MVPEAGVSNPLSRSNCTPRGRFAPPEAGKGGGEQKYI